MDEPVYCTAGKHRAHGSGALVEYVAAVKILACAQCGKRFGRCAECQKRSCSSVANTMRAHFSQCHWQNYALKRRVLPHGDD